MKKLRAYSVKEEPGAEWHIVVIADSARRAKVIGFNAIKSEFGDHWVEYLKIRVSLMKNIVVPDDMTIETYFNDCEGKLWMCQAWTGCEETQCGNYANRRILLGEAEGWDR